MANELEFFVPMRPPTATHQQKKIDTRGDRPIVYESPPTKAARAKLTAYLASHAPAAPFSGALALSVCWYFPPSAAHPSGSLRAIRPDLDNLNKLLADVMTALHFWHDDAQIARLLTAKQYETRCGIYVKIEQLEEQNDDNL